MRISKLSISVLSIAFAAGAAMAEDYKNKSTPTTERGTDQSMESGQSMDPSQSVEEGQSKPQTGATAPTSKEEVSEHVVIDFQPGQNVLTQAEMDELREAVKDARDKGQISRVEIAAWSDNAAPSTGNLPTTARTLATKRAEQVKSALKNISGEFGEIKVFNMAEGNHWLSRTINAEEAELESVFGRRDATQEMMNREDFEVIKDNGEPSKAVVLFKVNEK